MPRNLLFSVCKKKEQLQNSINCRESQQAKNILCGCTICFHEDDLLLFPRNIEIRLKKKLYYLLKLCIQPKYMAAIHFIELSVESAFFCLLSLSFVALR
jgi:hypothetical protein